MSGITMDSVLIDSVFDGVILAVRGNPESVEAQEQFGRFFEEWYDVALRLARLYCASRQDAEDSVQHAFVEFWRTSADGTLKTSLEGRKPRSWFNAVVVHEAMRLSKLAAREECDENVSEQDIGDLYARASSPDQAYFYADLLQRNHVFRGVLRKALSALSDDDRDLIVYRFVDKMTYDQIAQAMGDVDPAALRQRFHRAKSHLRVAIEREMRDGND